MKTLPRYLLRQVLAMLLMTVIVFTFVLLLGTALREILALLINRQATLRILTQAISLLIPFVLAFALPMGMLTATLLVFGRFSADQELTAARASGISLLSLVAPILILSLLLCGVSAAINLQIAPQCRVAYRALIDRLKVKFVGAYLPEGRFVKDFPGIIFYVEKNDGRNLKNVMITHLNGGTNFDMKIHAPRGYYEIDPGEKKIELHLFEAHSVTLVEGNWQPQTFGEWIYELDVSAGDRSARKPHLMDMTFFQLQEELRDLESRINLPVPIPKQSSERLREHLRNLRKQKQDIAEPARVQIHSQVALSFACFGFTLIGIPLGIRVHRRETNVNIGVALFLVLIYYGFVLFGQSLATRPEFAPHLMVWLPNFIFQAAGVVLLARANRGV